MGIAEATHPATRYNSDKNSTIISSDERILGNRVHERCPPSHFGGTTSKLLASRGATFKAYVTQHKFQLGRYIPSRFVGIHCLPSLLHVSSILTSTRTPIVLFNTSSCPLLTLRY
ncbi:hypothetical protein F442_22997 [Phytophthora nicotianae P10297]|uniref:Uncharacterized protein n=1 Tax=Phytophthora nicotianae P10297 TaxID=1317064 RepID=W2XZB8_PHYNI|nr:hypothetical protein F442_22997 [Phytophthora nicotianae P10297]